MNFSCHRADYLHIHIHTHPYIHSILNFFLENVCFRKLISNRLAKKIRKRTTNKREEVPPYFQPTQRCLDISSCGYNEKQFMYFFQVNRKIYFTFLSFKKNIGFRCTCADENKLTFRSGKNKIINYLQVVCFRCQTDMQMISKHSICSCNHTLTDIKNTHTLSMYT